MNVLSKMVLLPEKEYKSLRDNKEVKDVTEAKEVKEVNEPDKELGSNKDQQLYKQSIIDTIKQFDKRDSRKKVKKQKVTKPKIEEPKWRKLNWTSVKNF